MFGNPIWYEAPRNRIQKTETRNNKLITSQNHIKTHKKSYKKIAASSYRGSSKHNKLNVNNKYNIDYDNTLDNEYEIIQAID